MHVGETKTLERTCPCGTTTLTLTRAVIEVPKGQPVEGDEGDGPPEPVWCRGCDTIVEWPRGDA